MKLKILMGSPQDFPKKVEAFVNRGDVEVKHIAVSGFKTLFAMFLLWEPKVSEDS